MTPDGFALGPEQRLKIEVYKVAECAVQGFHCLLPKRLLASGTGLWDSQYSHTSPYTWFIGFENQGGFL